MGFGLNFTNIIKNELPPNDLKKGAQSLLGKVSQGMQDIRQRGSKDIERFVTQPLSNGSGAFGRIMDNPGLPLPKAVAPGTVVEPSYVELGSSAPSPGSQFGEMVRTVTSTGQMPDHSGPVTTAKEALGNASSGAVNKAKKVLGNAGDAVSNFFSGGTRGPNAHQYQEAFEAGQAAIQGAESNVFRARLESAQLNDAAREAAKQKPPTNLERVQAAIKQIREEDAANPAEKALRDQMVEKRATAISNGTYDPSDARHSTIYELGNFDLNYRKPARSGWGKDMDNAIASYRSATNLTTSSRQAKAIQGFKDHVGDGLLKEFKKGKVSPEEAQKLVNYYGEDNLRNLYKAQGINGVYHDSDMTKDGQAALRLIATAKQV